MSLEALITSQEKDTSGLSFDRLNQQLQNVRQMIAFYRQYPDLLIDFMKGPNSTFQFMFNQRIFLRAVMRHRIVYATFPRGFSKSFLSMMALMLRCILFPGSELFITTGGRLNLV